ncbi:MULTISPECIES: FlgB family protein [unclassified Sulfitobacter]|uniref:FlgB family protein n=1 Tax=unclassified Sulfitobacter TaxID=196795 RepID=UPI001593FEAE|nr:FlgB family protein [Sulfitobacter sp. HGT1]
MFEQLEVFKMSSAMAAHAGQRQAVISENVANSDTPGFVAKDLPSFQKTYHADQISPMQRATRAGHLHGAADRSQRVESFEVRAEASPNGNTVSLETEMLKSVAAKQQHDRALAIYKSALGVLRTAISK